MATANWSHELNQRRFCKQLRESNAKESNNKFTAESKGLATIQNNSLFVWDAASSYIVHYDLKNQTSNNDDKRDRFQVLMCTDPPRFEVDCLTFNKTGCLVAVWGHHGITVLELPQRWGKYGEFEGGKQAVSCKSTSIAEHYFATHTTNRLLQVLWHPGSETDTHITFLTSDNTLSTYDILEPDSPIHVIQLGESCPDIPSPSRRSFNVVLGEAAASFDFGEPLELMRRQRLHSTRLQPPVPDLVWPVYVVRGNGDVIMAYTDLRKNKSGAAKLPLQGPLLMHPPAEDNYGVDACAITVVDSQPAVVVVATCEGKLHHCVVLPSDDVQSLQSESSWNSLTENTSIYETPSEVSLYVYESVELELSLTMNKIETDEPIEDDYTCPIKIIKDPMYADRYHCTHGAGVHTVVLPWLQNLKNFCAEEGSDTDIPDRGECIVEHLVCTKPHTTSPSAPVYGLGIVKDLTFDPMLLTLTCDYEFITLPLRKRLQSENPPSLLSDTPSSVQESPLRRINKEPFYEMIQKILQRKVTNPLLKSGRKTDISQQECFQLLTRTTQIFREEYLQKQDLAQQEINKRVRLLKELRLQQEGDLKSLLESRNIIRDRAQNLAVKFDDCQDKNEDLLRRIERVMRKLQSRLPVLSTAERNMKKELETMEEQMESYRNSLQQLKKKQEYQERQLQHQQNQSVVSPVLRKGQVQQIREVLKQEQDDLSDMQKRINNLKLEAGV